MSPSKIGPTENFDCLNIAIYIEYADEFSPDATPVGCANPECIIKNVGVDHIQIAKVSSDSIEYRDATALDLEMDGFYGNSLNLCFRDAESFPLPAVNFRSSNGFFSCQTMIDILREFFAFEKCCEFYTDPMRFQYQDYARLKCLTHVDGWSLKSVYQPVWI